jgi:rhodanese-related sulfurtransferase
MVFQRLFGRPAASDDEVDPAEAKRRQDAGARLIDVREPSEWAAGHAPGASHIPLGQLPSRLAKLPKDRDLLFICASGSRSRSALSLARRAGFERAFSVSGGMSAWARSGLPVKR